MMFGTEQALLAQTKSGGVPGRVLQGAENGWRGILDLCNLNTEQSIRSREKQAGTEIVVDRHSTSQIPLWSYSMAAPVLKVETTTLSRMISAAADFQIMRAGV